ncbi:MAG: Sau3AI family type II restriction endonuclease [Anaerococcus sp.]|nr:Sau3AI family type II restriction endonuclease [Peptoniphilaceae bacterium]MDY3055010.1 Sau3AI family type II restriction endonuclease [Anaerococcus sp.]
MRENLPYDDTDPYSIFNYALDLVGYNFKDVLVSNIDDEGLLYEKIEYYNNPRGKGSLGNLLEKYYFYYEPNSNPAPDFEKAGTELKVTPYEKTKTGKKKAGERLVITMIPYDRPISDNFMESHLFTKIRLILFIFYFRNRELDRTEYPINYISLFNILDPTLKEDLKIIEDDYQKITRKIMDGRAHELSEGDTQYLGACTKGATAKSSIKKQYYSDIPAKRRAFSLKQSYMTYVFNNYILKNPKVNQAIFSDKDLENSDFETEILKKLELSYNKAEKDLYKEYDVNKSKNSNNVLVMRMLGVKTDNAEEFEKANIQIKTIRVRKNGKLREHMSFSNFNILEFVEEEFEDSTIYKLFSETKFLFIVFQENKNGDYCLRGAKFWNMPIADLEGQAHKEWKMYQDKFKSKINFIVKESDDNVVVYNDLPKARYTEILHIRPHATNTAYVIDGVKYGKGTEKDMDILPSGDKMTKQSFWLNKDYIYNQIYELLEIEGNN